MRESEVQSEIFASKLDLGTCESDFDSKVLEPADSGLGSCFRCNINPQN